MCSLGGLQGGGHLGVRGSEKACNLFGQRLVGGKAGELTLPEVEIAPGKPIEIACVVVFRGHEATIAHRRANGSFARANRALSHCGISAKVICPT